MPRVAIIGSGFGGSIAAFRFRQRGWDVDLYELGEDWPSTKMQQTQDTRYLYRLFRDYPVDYYARTDTLRPKVVIAQGMGVGGGSLVYSGIHLRAPTEALEGWPTGWRRADLDFYYGKVETNLGVRTYLRGEGYDFPRRSVFAQRAAAAGLPAPQPNPLAMQGCTMCGWCVPNCIFDKKQSMALTYLARAKALTTGTLRILPLHKAMRIERVSGRYRVLWYRTDTRGDNYHLVNSGTLSYYNGLDADRCVIACGAVESPALLQRSLGYLSSLPSGTTNWLGKKIDGHGDAVVGGIVPETTDSFKGAIMMDHITMNTWANGRWEPQYVLEDIHSIPAGVGVKFPASFPSMGNDWTGTPYTWGLGFKQKVKNFAGRMLGIAIMGKQGGTTPGNITVTNDNGVAVVGSVGGVAYQPPAGSIEAARAMIEASVGGKRGEIAYTPWEREQMIATVHPTGGCAMGPAGGGVVNTTTLEVHNNAGLHVIDGSVFPSGTWRNPSHTISAVAEKALTTLLGTPPAW